ncbi:MAG: TonB-dependent receptor, partial [Desulfobulbaceae bacterium]|nr:TonB-dependent receptor [Desulfobulbaceae bacterium]
VDDVLNRVAGVFVGYTGQDFNGNTFLDIHDSSFQQVVIYLDGVRLSKATDDLSFANVVPIRIIKRIEVIKGAASSTWGSALGGVINIITKDTGKNKQPEGSLHGSYGEFGSQDYSGELAGKWARLGYYLAAGDQTSDGIRDNKYFDNQSVYGKIDLDLADQMLLSFSGCSSAPDYKASYFTHPSFDFTENLNDRNEFLTGSFDWMLWSRMNLHVNSYYFINDYQASGYSISSDQPLWHNKYLQKTTGINGRMDWMPGDQQVVLGFDFVKNKLYLSDKLTDGPESKLSEELMGWYINDTIRINKLTIIPGLRFDQLSDTTDMVSPGLGATYQLADHTLLRGGISQGFRKPPITYTDTENGSLYANNELEPETVWSYQLGAETGAARFCRLKSTFFFHDAKKSFLWSRALGAYDNIGNQKRRGLELELETISWHHLVLELNFTYVHLENIDMENGYKREANLILSYDNPELISLELVGHYALYGELEGPAAYNPIDNTVLWDISLKKQIWRREQSRSEIFLVGHNLSNESQYDDELTKNGPRWLEVGLKFSF